MNSGSNLYTHRPNTKQLKVKINELGQQKKREMVLKKMIKANINELTERKIKFVK